jgi:hypothetical protein
MTIKEVDKSTFLGSYGLRYVVVNLEEQIVAAFKDRKDAENYAKGPLQCPASSAANPMV